MSKLFDMKRHHLITVFVALILVIAACQCSTTTTGLGTGSGDGTVSVTNNSSIEICYLYVSPSTDDSWGDDRLGADTLPAGESFTVTGLAAGSYDFRAEDCNENVIDEEFDMTVNAGGTTTWTFTDN